MTKNDLRDWMIVEDNKGRKYFVDRVHNALLEYGAVEGVNRVWMLDYLTDDLCRVENNDLYITKVFQPTDGHISYIFDDAVWLSRISPIWVRSTPPAAVEMTIAEIEKKLGIKHLKIVKET